MKQEDTEALISYRMQRAEESLRAAEIMSEKDMFSFAMNRIYYSMFYAVQAALILKGVSFSKHGQVKAYLNRELVKTGIIPISLGRIYNKAFEYRQKFDLCRLRGTGSGFGRIVFERSPGVSGWHRAISSKYHSKIKITACYTPSALYTMLFLVHSAIRGET